jgi:integrase
MQTYSRRPIDATKILFRTELSAVLADLKRKAPRSKSTRLNLSIFRLACCCGLRASEIAKVRVADVVVETRRPHLRIRRGAAKGGRSRIVPLWWDAGTLADLAAWKAERSAQDARGEDYYICALRRQVGPAGTAAQTAKRGKPSPLIRHSIRRRFRTACKVLGRERLATLTVHHGRHTFISHALAGNRTLAEVRDAAGHANVSITSAYLHVAVDDDGRVGQLFAPGFRG